MVTIMTFGLFTYILEPLGQRWIVKRTVNLPLDHVEHEPLYHYLTSIEPIVYQASYASARPYGFTTETAAADFVNAQVNEYIPPPVPNDF